MAKKLLLGFVFLMLVSSVSAICGEFWCDYESIQPYDVGVLGVSSDYNWGCYYGGVSSPTCNIGDAPSGNKLVWVQQVGYPYTWRGDRFYDEGINSGRKIFEFKPYFPFTSGMGYYGLAKSDVTYYFGAFGIGASLGNVSTNINVLDATANSVSYNAVAGIGDETESICWANPEQYTFYNLTGGVYYNQSLYEPVWCSDFSQGIYLQIILDWRDDSIQYRIVKDNDDRTILSQSVVYNITYSGGSIDTDLMFDVLSGNIGLGGIGVDEFHAFNGLNAPSVTTPVISPQEANETTQFTCNYVFTDRDGDADASLVEWFVNGVYSSTGKYSAVNYASGDYVYCKVTPFDSVLYGVPKISSSVVIGGVISQPELIPFNLSLSSLKDVGVNIRALDYYVADSGFSGYLAFVGLNGSSSVAGVVDLSSPSTLSGVKSVVTGSQYYTGVSAYETGFWTSSQDGIQRWDGIQNSFSLGFVSPDNFSSSGEDYYDVEALSDTQAVACYYFGGYNSLVTFEYNGSEILDMDLLSVAGCKDVLYAGNGLVFVDMENSGLGLFNLSNISNIVSVASVDDRTGYVWFDRHDTLGYLSGKVWLDNGVQTGYTYEVPALDTYGLCVGVFSDTRFASVEMVDGYLVYADLSDNGLYACDLNTGLVQKVYDNSDFAYLGRDMIVYDEGSVAYVYTFADEQVQAFRFTDYYTAFNQLPYFMSQTADSQFVNNLNPIAVGVENNGLDNPEVSVFPLNCINSNIYDCSRDVESDTRLYAVDKDYTGSVDSGLVWNDVDGFSVSYASAGNYTMRIYLTDDVHPNTYSVYRDFSIEVRGNATPLPANYSTLRFKVFDENTGEALESVFVTISGVGSSYTDVQGEVEEVVPEDVYEVEFSKTGYVSQVHSYSTSSVQQLVYLEPSAVADKRTLQITLKSTNGSVIPNGYVQTKTKILNVYDYKFTDLSGKATFFPTEDNVVVVVDVDGYEPFSAELFIPFGSLVARTITLSREGLVVEGIEDSFNVTGCRDYITGVLLCDYDKVTCDEDADCLTGYCNKNPYSTSGHCSNFNWYLCDEQEMDRGNRCIYKNVFNGVMRSVGNWIVDNFFFVLILVLLLIGALILALRNR